MAVLGFLHPIIHLGFGIEFGDPTIVVEGIAQTAIHANEVAIPLQKAEASSKGQVSRSMFDLIQDVMSDPSIRNAPAWGDGSIIEDDFLLEAPERLTTLAGAWKVDLSEFEEKVAEMINVNAYFTGAAQRPTKKIKMDFFFIHNVNCSIFFSAFVKDNTFRLEEKARLLEWKGRADIIAYGSRGAPELRLDEIIHYQPKHPGPWESVFKRANEFDDDSHLSKFIRALANGERVCAPYEARDDGKFPIKGDMWLQLAHMGVDSMDNETYLGRWIRGAGFDQQWAKFADRGSEQQSKQNGALETTNLLNL